MLVPENSSFALLELMHPKMKIITLPDSLFVKRIKWVHRWRELRRMHGWPRKVVKIPRDIWYHYLPKSYPFCKESLLKYLVCLHTPILVYVLSMKRSLRTQSCPTLCDTTDCSLPGSSVNQAPLSMEGRPGGKVQVTQHSPTITELGQQSGLSSYIKHHRLLFATCPTAHEMGAWGLRKGH